MMKITDLLQDGKLLILLLVLYTPPVLYAPNSLKNATDRTKMSESLSISHLASAASITVPIRKMF